MALDLGSIGLPLVAPTPIVPFNNGLAQFSNQYPWQQDKQQIWQIVQQNGQNIQMPFNFQQKAKNNSFQQQPNNNRFQQQPNNNPLLQQPNNNRFQQQPNNNRFQQNQNKTNDANQKSQWQLNQLNLNQEQGQNKTENQDSSSSKSWGDGWQNKNETSTASEEEESKDDQMEAEKEALEEAQEKFEDWLEKTDGKKKQLFKDFTLYTIMLFPFLLYERTTANYFAGTELMSVILEKLGVNDDNNLAFLLFVQCVDLVALTKGRFRLVDGYKQNWYQEVYDYTLTKLRVPDGIRLGTQMLMPQSPAPDYEPWR